MSSSTLRVTIIANSAEIQRLQARVDQTVQHRDKSSEENAVWKSACAEFHARYDDLAFPGGYSTARERIASGDIDAIEAALCFVECRPYFFRSGYMFKELIPLLKRAGLTPDQRNRFDSFLSAYEIWRASKRTKRGD